MRSLPAWGEWIEILHPLFSVSILRSLPAWGEWIEIDFDNVAHLDVTGLSPHGESGLKSRCTVQQYTCCRVSPRMGRVD